MVARARRVLAEIDALVADVAACKDEVAGTVRVGMIGTTARWLVPRLIDAARLRHPKLRLVVVEGNTTGLEPQLAAGQLDLAILNLPVPGRDLVARPLFEEDLMLACPRGTRWPRRAERSPSRTSRNSSCSSPCRGPRSATSSTRRSGPSASPFCPPPRSTGCALIASLAFEGYGPAVLPATAIPSVLRHQVHPLPVEGLPRRRVGVAQRSRGLPSAPTRALLELLTLAVEKPDGRPQGLHVPS